MIDLPGGKIPVQEYMRNETRFRMVERIDPERFRKFAIQSQLSAERRVATYQHMAQMKLPIPHEVVVAGSATTEEEES